MKSGFPLTDAELVSFVRQSSEMAATRIEALIADAERWQWALTKDPEEFLTDATGQDCWDCQTKEEFDAAVDRARGKQ